MKQTISLSLLFILLFLSDADGQTEVMKYFKDNDNDLQAIVHTTDTDGSTYLLALKSRHYPGPAFPIEGERGSEILYKIDKAGNKEWEKAIPGGMQIFITGNAIFIPYAVESGCAIKIKGGETLEGPGTKICSMFINKSDGTVIENKCFDDKVHLDFKGTFDYDDSCPKSYFLSAVVNEDNSISYINCVDQVYRNELDKNNPHKGIRESVHKIVVVKRDDTLGYISEMIHGTMKYPYRDNLVYDESEHEYIIGDSTGLFIYDNVWNLMRKIILPQRETFGSVMCKITYNDQYYVVNYGYGINSNQHKSYTAVYKKKGKQISVTESPHYDVLKISKDNIIYAIPEAQYNLSDSVVLTRMDIHQHVLGVRHIDIPGGTLGNAGSISFTNNDELIITGTFAIAPLPDHTRFPGAIYYYKQKMEQ